MNHGQNLRDLLEPLGVYRWEGSFQWGELQSEGAALDGVADALASLQQEMNLTTAQGEGLDRVLELLGRERDREDPETLRETLAALLRIGNGLRHPGGGGRDGDKAGGGGVLSGGRGGAGGLRKAEGTGGGHPALPPSGGVSLCGNDRRRFVRGLCAGR